MKRIKTGKSLWFRQHRGFVITILGFIIFMSVFSVLMSAATELQLKKVRAFRNEIEAMGVKIQGGLVESPAVKIPVDKDGFLEKIKELGADVVYCHHDSRLTHYGRHYYVFNEEYTIAYFVKYP